MIARLVTWFAAITGEIAEHLNRLARWLGRFRRDDFALWEAELNTGMIPDYIGEMEGRDG